MVSEYVYSPHVDFLLTALTAIPATRWPVSTSTISMKFYYEIEGSRRYFIEDAAYIVNAGCVVLIGENQIHKTASLGTRPPAALLRTSAGNTWAKSPTYSRRWISSRS